MLIEFRCGNYSRFDEKTGQYLVCGQRMSAAAEDAGLLVSCPRCKKDCEVPIPKRRTRKTVASQEPDSVPLEQDAGLATPNVPPTAALPKPKQQRCPKCGGVLDAKGVCGACRWVRPRFSKAKMSLDEMEMEPAGMMLWFSQIMSEGVPMKILSLLAHVIIPMLLTALMVFAVLVVGGFWGGFMFLIFFLSLLLYIALAYKGYQFLRDGNARLAWFQKPFWYGILALCRARNWQGFDAKYRGRNVVDFHGDPITDTKLAQRKELKSAQVLDLEGTLITDQTIEQLYRLKHLQCLVVRNTKVSHLAVTRLQQSFPKMWIWH